MAGAQTGTVDQGRQSLCGYNYFCPRSTGRIKRCTEIIIKKSVVVDIGNKLRAELSGPAHSLRRTGWNTAAAITGARPQPQEDRLEHSGRNTYQRGYL